MAVEPGELPLRAKTRPQKGAEGTKDILDDSSICLCFLCLFVAI
jgi:hypothetical protein